jgi:hypothetical protein
VDKRTRQCITDAQQVGASSETTNNSGECTPSGPNPRRLTLSNDAGKTDKARSLGANYLCNVEQRGESAHIVAFKH